MRDEAKAERDELAYAAIRCCMQLINGVNAGIGAYFFSQMARVETFTEFTRGMALYLQSVFSNYRGDMQIAQSACKQAIEHILNHSNSTGRDYLSLIARINAHRSAHFFSMLNPAKLDSSVIEQAMKSVRSSCHVLGIGDTHFKNSGRLISDLEREKDESVRLDCYFSCSLYHLIEALHLYVSDANSSQSFVNNMKFNQAVATLNPRTACVMLTPMASLANITGNLDIANELYHWRNNIHPVRTVNVERDKINENEKHTSEYAANILSLYNYLRHEQRRGAVIGNNSLSEVKNKIAAEQKNFELTQLGGIARYFKRAVAGSEDTKKDYVASEMVSAGTHHMHIGPWEDDLIKKFSK